MSGGIAPDNFITRLICRLGATAEDGDPILSTTVDDYNTNGSKHVNGFLVIAVASFCAVLVSLLNVYLVLSAIFEWH